MTKKCEKCGAEIMDLALECPKCGYLYQSIVDDPRVEVDQMGKPFLAVPDFERTAKVERSVEERPKQPVTPTSYLIIIVIAIVLLVAFFLYIPIEYAVVLILLGLCMLIRNIRGGGA